MNEPWLVLAIELAAGLALAACCGLRAFLPPLVLGLTGRLGVDVMLLDRPLLGSHFEWLASTPALVVFGSAVVLELAADKIPALDHVLDVVQTIVRPLAGALVVAGVLSPARPLQAAVAGLIVGAPIAGLVHLGKAKIRLLSTAGTGGLASPAISIVEDVASFVGSAAAVVVPLLALVLLLTGAWVTWRLVRGFLRRVGRLRRDLGSPPG